LPLGRRLLQIRQKLSNEDIKALSVLGLLFGVGLVYFGVTGSCACPASVVGKPAPFNQFQGEIAIGVIAIIVSIVGAAFSFRKPKTREVK
jgi:hypothetical protein